MSQRYAELQVTSNYSFLRGASHPDELVTAAAALGLSAIAITDRNSLAGIVRAHQAARSAGLRLVVGTRLDLTEGRSFLCFPTDRSAYGRLCRLLTLGRRRAEKGDCRLSLADLRSESTGQILVALPPARLDAGFIADLAQWKSQWPDHLYLGLRRRFRGDDGRRMDELAGVARRLAIPLLASNDVHYHSPERRPLQDVLTCLRLGHRIEEAGWRLHHNAERHLKPPAEMARLFAGYEAALAHGLAVVERCSFDLGQIEHHYPCETEWGDPQETLTRWTWEGATARYPAGIPDKVAATLRHELALIGQLSYAPYFLTVYDIVCFARQRGILCQGRGSAANSAVCFCLGITSVDPSEVDLLFERFISASRNEPPDIDIDVEHERREEILQYLYQRYGRSHTALTATVIHYRYRSALAEVGKVLGLSTDVIGSLARHRWGRSRDPVTAAQLRELGLNPDDLALRQTLVLADQLVGFPRHLSQHVGGFVMTSEPLQEIVPIENAAMADRTVIQWDKDDLDIMGLLKVDVLALGMLTCIRKAFELLRYHNNLDLDLATVPREDPAVYDMLCRGDSIGVFQVESRAQMTMLPRLKPRCFYDLVIEVAIVRPGPIQGDMVHPYLRRRAGQESADIPFPELTTVLQRTLGVPLFQEQAMKIAMVAGGFSAAEADQLRRAMASFRRTGAVERFRDKLIDGMTARGYPLDFAERLFRQIEGFGEYGFPESHAASFARLVYVSAWLKCHHPAVFACALLNSQPMGFYAPAQIIRDLAAHGGEILPVDVNHSQWDCYLETDQRSGRLCLRLGFRQITGIRHADIATLVACRADGYANPQELWRRTGLNASALDILARADAFASMGLSRRAALWAVRAFQVPPPPLFAAAGLGVSADPPGPALPAMSLGEEVVEDYTSLRLSLKAHPLALMRDSLRRQAVLPAGWLVRRSGGRVAVAGLVLVRQRPSTASGVIFLTLEDETGVANIIIWPTVFEAARAAVLSGRLLQIGGRLQREGSVIHVIAEEIVDRSAWLQQLTGNGTTWRKGSRDFC